MISAGKKYFLMALTAVLMAVGLESCRTEICYDHYRALDITFEWEQEWERNYGMNHEDNWDTSHYGLDYDAFRPDKPEWVVAMSFEGETKTDEHYFDSYAGKAIISGSGNESMLFYNGDTEYIILSEMASLEEASARATDRSRSSLASMIKDFPGSRSTNPPDILYSAYIDKLPEVELHERKHMNVKMKPLVFTYLVRYEFECGIEYVASARGALGGVAESIYLRDGSTPDKTSIVLYDCTVKNYGCEAVVRTFGAPGFNDQYYTKRMVADTGYSLNLEIRLKNGKIFEFDYDISDQMALQPRGGVITVKGIKVEVEQGGSTSGFDVDLSGWGDNETIELPVTTERT